MTEDQSFNLSNRIFQETEPWGKPQKTILETSIKLPSAAASILAVNPVIAKAWVDLMCESARFVIERLRRDLEMQKEMIACKSPSQLLRVQSELYKSSVDQYFEEVTQYSQMSVTALQSIVEESQAAHISEYDDVPV